MRKTPFVIALCQAGPLMRASALFHIGAASALVLIPEQWPLILGAVIADHALISAAGLWPRSTLLGPNLTRLPAAAVLRGEIALTIDDGPEPQVTPRVLDLLDAAGVKASFFCTGEKVLHHPTLAREMVARGHRIENHSQRHSNGFPLFGPTRMREEIVMAQQSIFDTVGREPRCFRPASGLRNPFLQPVLADLGLRLATWTRRSFDTRCGDADTVHARLTRNLAAGDILLMHDGNAARSATGEPVILAALPRLLDTLKAANLRAVTLDDALRE